MKRKYSTYMFPKTGPYILGVTLNHKNYFYIKYVGWYGGSEFGGQGAYPRFQEMADLLELKPKLRLTAEYMKHNGGIKRDLRTCDHPLL